MGYEGEEWGTRGRSMGKRSRSGGNKTIFFIMIHDDGTSNCVVPISFPYKVMYNDDPSLLCVG